MAEQRNSAIAEGKVGVAAAGRIHIEVGVVILVVGGKHRTAKIRDRDDGIARQAIRSKDRVALAGIVQVVGCCGCS